jgi:hypothetical protein
MGLAGNDATPVRDLFARCESGEVKLIFSGTLFA